MNLQQLLGNNKYVTKKELQDIINYFASLKYVQGPPGKDAEITNEMIEKIIAAATPIKGVDYDDGERGKRGKPGKDGKDGDDITPEQLGKKLKELPDNLKIKIGDLADADVLYNKIREVVSASDSIGAALQAEADAREALEKKVASITISRGASGALNFLEGGTNLGKYPNLNLVGFTVDETGDTITVTSPGVTGNTLITSADSSVAVSPITGGFDLSVDIGDVINNWTPTEWNSFLTDFYTNIDWSQVDITEVDFSTFDWTQVDVSQFNATQWNDFITNLTTNWTTANWNDFTSSLVSNWSVANYNDFTDGFITNITEIQSQNLWNELSTSLTNVQLQNFWDSVSSSLTNVQLQNFWNSLFTNLTNAQIEALGDLVFNNLTTTQIDSIITGVNDNITSEQVFNLLNNITGATSGDALIWDGTEWVLQNPGGSGGSGGSTTIELTAESNLVAGQPVGIHPFTGNASIAIKDSQSVSVAENIGSSDTVDAVKVKDGLYVAYMGQHIFSYTVGSDNQFIEVVDIVNPSLYRNYSVERFSDTKIMVVGQRDSIGSAFLDIHFYDIDGAGNLTYNTDANISNSLSGNENQVYVKKISSTVYSVYASSTLGPGLVYVFTTDGSTVTSVEEATVVRETPGIISKLSDNSFIIQEERSGTFGGSTNIHICEFDPSTLVITSNSILNSTFQYIDIHEYDTDKYVCVKRPVATSGPCSVITFEINGSLSIVENDSLEVSTTTNRARMVEYKNNYYLTNNLFANRCTIQRFEIDALDQITVTEDLTSNVGSSPGFIHSYLNLNSYAYQNKIRSSDIIIPVLGGGTNKLLIVNINNSRFFSGFASQNVSAGLSSNIVIDGTVDLFTDLHVGSIYVIREGQVTLSGYASAGDYDALQALSNTTLKIL